MLARSGAAAANVINAPWPRASATRRASSALAASGPWLGRPSVSTHVSQRPPGPGEIIADTRSSNTRPSVRSSRPPWQWHPSVVRRHRGLHGRVDGAGGVGEPLAQRLPDGHLGVLERLGGAFGDQAVMGAAAGGLESPHRSRAGLVDREVGTVVDPQMGGPAVAAGNASGHPLGAGVWPGLDPHADREATHIGG